MFTTFDCNFIEHEFYYNHLNSQGEPTPSIDPLSWLDTLPTNNLESNLITETQNDDASAIVPESPSTDVSNEGTPETTQNFRDNSLPSAIVYSDHSDADNIPESRLPARSTRGIPPKRYSPEHPSRTARYPVVNLVRGNVSKEVKTFNQNLYTVQIPRNAQEAKDSSEWHQAMETEMQALEKNVTWEKCNLPSGVRPVGCKWVFTVKHKADGTIERHKARLVAKGYTQTYGIDYSETFSPVAKINTIRVLFSLAVNLDWPLHQFDVKNAFLHGDLEEEVYMEAPPGFSDGFKRNEVCRLKKALYGLKQSPRAWFGKFTIAMRNCGYRQSNADHTLFLKGEKDQVTCLIIYVDDIIITGNDNEEITRLRENLFNEFEMKDLGKLKYFLGIEVMRSKDKLFLSQRKYILDLLAETGLLDCKPAETPMVANYNFRENKNEETADREKYQRLVGKLIYLSHTRPDIAYAVGIVSQFMHNPQAEHMNATIRILRYLKGTCNFGILFSKNGHLNVQGYTDADWAGNQVDRRSTSGYFTFVGGNLVTWRSKKQKVVSLSSAEAEFRGMSKGIAELLWIKKLLTEIGFPPQTTMELMCDNKAAISIAENPVQHDRTKHVEVDRHFIKEKIEKGIITTPYTRSEDQLADILTKAGTKRTFYDILNKLHVLNPHDTT